MTIKIETEKLWQDAVSRVLYDQPAHPIRDLPVRIVRESDWRKVMAVVRAADKQEPYLMKSCGAEKTDYAIHALRKHLSKRKESKP